MENIYKASNKIANEVMNDKEHKRGAFEISTTVSITVSMVDSIITDGEYVKTIEGFAVIGPFVGFKVGSTVGFTDGLRVGLPVGIRVGFAEGASVGDLVGSGVTTVQSLLSDR